MATTADIRTGLVIEYKGHRMKIVEFLHVKPGKGGAFVRTKLKNIVSGKVIGSFNKDLIAKNANACDSTKSPSIP